MLDGRTDVYLPAPHATDALQALMPRLSLYVPAPQSVHATCSVVTWYFPSPHSLHVLDPTKAVTNPDGQPKHGPSGTLSVGCFAFDNGRVVD